MTIIRLTEYGKEKIEGVPFHYQLMIIGRHPSMSVFSAVIPAQYDNKSIFS